MSLPTSHIWIIDVLAILFHKAAQDQSEHMDTIREDQFLQILLQIQLDLDLSLD